MSLLQSEPVPKPRNMPMEVWETRLQTELIIERSLFSVVVTSFYYWWSLNVNILLACSKIIFLKIESHLRSCFYGWARLRHRRVGTIAPHQVYPRDVTSHCLALLRPYALNISFCISKEARAATRR